MGIGITVFILFVFIVIIGIIVAIVTAAKRKKANYNEVHFGNAKSTAASALHIISKVITILFTGIGGIVGYYFGNEQRSIALFYDSHDKSSLFVLFLYTTVGLIVGLIVGFIISLLVRYFGELGENTKKVADATTEQAKETKFQNDNSITRGLMEYKQLLDQGIITQEEFENQKNKLLSK